MDHQHPEKHETVLCPICGKSFQKRIIERKITCSTACGFKHSALKENRKPYESQLMRKTKEKIRKESEMASAHRETIFGVEYEEGCLI